MCWPEKGHGQCSELRPETGGGKRVQVAFPAGQLTDEKHGKPQPPSEAPSAYQSSGRLREERGEERSCSSSDRAGTEGTC